MVVHRQFCERIEPGTIDLSPEESRHAASALRVRVGDAVELFDGRGTVADAKVARVVRGAVSVEVTLPQPQVPRPQPLLTLCIAVPKGTRQHVLVEKCTELGVSGIQPIVAERSTVKPTGSIVSRWRRYAIEAGKQSRQAWLPEVLPPAEFHRTVETKSTQALNLIAVPGAGSTSLAAVLGDGAPTEITVWIGPEGGFAPEEVETAESAGLQPVRLGQSVLRIETAAIAVAAAVRLLRE